MNAKMNILRYLTKTDARTGKQNTLTTAQARSMFKVDNIAARIYDLRQDGFRIYTNNRKLKDGRMVKAYRLHGAEEVSQLFT